MGGLSVQRRREAELLDMPREQRCLAARVCLSRQRWVRVNRCLLCMLRHVSTYMQVCTRVLHCGGEQAPQRRAPCLPNMQTGVRWRASDGCCRGRSAHYSSGSELQPCRSERPCQCTLRQGQLPRGSWLESESFGISAATFGPGRPGSGPNQKQVRCL